MTDVILQTVNLSKSFGAVRVTDNLNLSVRSGEVHALIGPNGAGKTSLIGQLSGELQPDAGRIVFRGEDVTQSTIQHRVKRGLARSFQITSILQDFTALENVVIAVQSRIGGPLKLGVRPSTDPELVEPARKLLERVDLDARASTLSCNLAHGEQRQLEIAIALALEPAMVLLDEPMAGMGKQDTRRMTALLASLKSHITMLLVEHDMDVVFSLSDRVTVMVYGVAICSDVPDRVQSNAAVLDAYLGRE
ncbi:MAG: ABC transporter ATP-binding protein [Pseudorhodoplanes sp.]|uniref:ABC transporter ATP-binding protein n=1 Tax=Pseudorhodoplanes sp. TaxID=1934341 RepID=UPI003D126486